MRVLFVPLLACLLLSCGPSPEAPASRAVAPRFADADPHDWLGVTPSHYPVHGIDVSRYQGDIDWARVRASGVRFAFIKATEGGDRADERFAANWQGAARAGVLRGAYHFYYFCRPALEQAAWFMSHVPKDRAALPPVLDLEWNPYSPTCRTRPDPATVRSEAGRFLQALAIYYRKRPIVYTSVDFYADNELWRLGGTPFWLRSVAGHPSTTYPDQAWAFWQYTATGLVAGISGPTDVNVFAGTPAQWARFAGAR